MNGNAYAYAHGPANPTILEAKGIVKTVGTGAGELTILKGIDLSLRAAS